MPGIRTLIYLLVGDTIQPIMVPYKGMIIRIVVGVLPATLNIRRPGRDFPGGTVVRKLPANAGDAGSSAGPGRSRMPRNN